MILVLACAGAEHQAPHPETAPQTPVQAATDAAMGGLSDQIDRLPLGPKLSVGSYLDDVKGHSFLRATLQRAQVVGGPRPMGGGLVQVRLDIGGRVVADALVQVAITNARRSKVTPDFVAREARAWSDRTFTAVGVSGPKTDPLVPAAGTSGGPSEPVVPQALEAAKRSAALAVLDQIATVPISPDQSVRYLLDLPGVTDALVAFLVTRPVKSAEGKPSGEVHVTLCLDKAEFFGVLETASALARAELNGKLITDAQWAAIQPPVLVNVPNVIEGVALPKGAPRIGGDQRVAIGTERPPEWFFLSLEATGTSHDAGSKLLTASLAEAAARSELTKQIEALLIGDHLTIGRVEQLDRRFVDAVAQAVARSRVSRVEYLQDGSATVKMTTDARYLWQDIVVASQGRP